MTLDLKALRAKWEAREMAGGLASPKNGDARDALELIDALEAARAERDLLLKPEGPRLDGYRELGAKCAALETERDAARAEVRRALALLEEAAKP